jgi:hypothetical protein
LASAAMTLLVAPSLLIYSLNTPVIFDFRRIREGPIGKSPSCSKESNWFHRRRCHPRCLPRGRSNWFVLTWFLPVETGICSIRSLLSGY